MVQYSGKQKLDFCARLGEDWWKVAAFLDIPPETQQTFPQGQEGRVIWEWVENRQRLDQLQAALNHINREDLALVLEPPGTQAAAHTVTWKGSPYPGLCHFTERDAPIFFGRERETETLLQKLSGHPFLAVVGASGSGKPSLVAAGVLPRLGDIPPRTAWDSLRCTPAGIFDDPFLALAARLEFKLEQHGERDSTIADTLRRRGDLSPYMNRLRGGDSSRPFLLFIDQFEELFTRTKPEHHHPFLSMLARATKISNLHIIITLRADFYPACLKHQTLETLLNAGMVSLAAPNKRAMYDMIIGPAALADLTFDDGLPWRILEETGDDPGSLALMAFALAELYRTSQPGTQLRETAYDSFGGVPGAIAKRAESTYQKFRNIPDEDKEKVHEMITCQTFSRVFKELVEVDPDRGVATRKRAPGPRFAGVPEAESLIKAFTEARLLVRNSDPGQQDIVEVAHEALLTNWPRLHNWIEARFDEFRLLRQVKLDAAEWERQGRPESHLWRHERLEPVYRMVEQLEPDLSPIQQAFIRPEADRLMDRIADPATPHQQRATIGDRLADIGDTRKGVGLNEDGLPDLIWYRVPEGSITLENQEGIFKVEAFEISKHPITLVQYRSFLEAPDGYQNPLWWDGLTERQGQPGIQYRQKDNHPAENVSWYDAMAFCRWLSHRLGDSKTIIRFPTEWEWQQAATGGRENYAYPWGQEWHPDYANTDESGLSRTTAVGMYPLGQSLIGIMDMAGNVWEWCLNAYENPSTTDPAGDKNRVLRGGSWNRNQYGAHALYRYNRHPNGRSYSLGFRVVRSSPIS
jgi:formylglycine-generating enzyme required for sulfatase activity